MCVNEVEAAAACEEIYKRSDSVIVHILVLELLGRAAPHDVLHAGGAQLAVAAINRAGLLGPKDSDTITLIELALILLNNLIEAEKKETLIAIPAADFEVAAGCIWKIASDAPNII